MYLLPHSLRSRIRRDTHDSQYILKSSLMENLFWWKKHDSNICTPNGRTVASERERERREMPNIKFFVHLACESYTLRHGLVYAPCAHRPTHTDGRVFDFSWCLQRAIDGRVSVNNSVSRNSWQSRRHNSTTNEAQPNCIPHLITVNRLENYNNVCFGFSCHPLGDFNQKCLWLRRVELERGVM